MPNATTTMRNIVSTSTLTSAFNTTTMRNIVRTSTLTSAFNTTTKFNSSATTQSSIINATTNIYNSTNWFNYSTIWPFWPNVPTVPIVTVPTFINNDDGYDDAYDYYWYSYYWYLIIVIVLCLALLITRLVIARRQEIARIAANQRSRVRQRCATTSNRTNNQPNNNGPKENDLPPDYDEAVKNINSKQQLSNNDDAVGGLATSASCVTVETEVGSNANSTTDLNVTTITISTNNVSNCPTPPTYQNTVVGNTANDNANIRNNIV